MIDLLEPDGNIYTGSHSIEIFETMELTLECTPYGGLFFCLGWEVPESLNGSGTGLIGSYKSLFSGPWLHWYGVSTRQCTLEYSGVEPGNGKELGRREIPGE